MFNKAYIGSTEFYFFRVQLAMSCIHARVHVHGSQPQTMLAFQGWFSGTLGLVCSSVLLWSIIQASARLYFLGELFVTRGDYSVIVGQIFVSLRMNVLHQTISVSL